jgi:hypothetical protein
MPKERIRKKKRTNEKAAGKQSHEIDDAARVSGIIEK